jgi:hypothetical protein
MFRHFLPNKNKIATLLNSNSSAPIWESKHGQITFHKGKNKRYFVADGRGEKKTQHAN